jgi:uncharacterized membrane protein YeiH
MFSLFAVATEPSTQTAITFLILICEFGSIITIIVAGVVYIIWRRPLYWRICYVASGIYVVCSILAWQSTLMTIDIVCATFSLAVFSVTHITLICPELLR